MSKNRGFSIYLGSSYPHDFQDFVEKCKNKGNCLSKELAQAELEGDNSVAIGIIKKVYQALLLVKERLADVVYSGRDQWGEDRLERAIDDINKLYENYAWSRELSRGYMIE